MHRIRRNLQVIGLVFVQLLDGRARPLGLDEKHRLVKICLVPERNPGLPRERFQEALFSAFQARLLKTFEGDAEPVVDEKLSCTQLYLGR